MVLKEGKFGVRSGNTFKASDSKYLRVYRKQAFVVRKFVRNDPNILDAQTFDGVVGADNIKSNNVPFSLNKKGRWNLPEIIKEDILNGDHSDDNVGIQLVERHKLSKQSNCIGIFSTTGPVKEVSTEKSKRNRKRSGYIQANSILNANSTRRRARQRQRRRRAHNGDENDEVPAQSQPDQLRYEVLYPSSSTSSIIYTPKYIGHDTRNSFVWQGYHDGRGKQRHIRKVANIIQDSLYSMDDDFDESEDEDVLHDDIEVPVERETTLVIEDLLKHAYIADKLTNNKVKLRKTSESRNIGTDTGELRKRHHVIYEEKIPVDTDADGASGSAVNATNTPYIQPVIVILAADQIDSRVLTQCFGKGFIECDCFPRKFIIDISDKVSAMDMFKGYNNHTLNRINASLVFVHDVKNEINTLTHDIYNVFLNTNFDDSIQSEKIETLFDYMETDVDEIITRTLFFIETLPTDALIVEYTDHLFARKTEISNLEECACWQTTSYVPDGAFLLQTFANPENSLKDAIETGYEVVSHFDSYNSDESADVTSPEDRFCSICYDVLGGNKSATALISCGHWFCDDCWRDYLTTKVRSGTVKMLCPEYDCDRTVDPGTMLSLINMRDIIKHAKCCHDTKVEQHEVTRWCPNEKCGRVLQSNSVNVKTAQCQCGEQLCLECLGKPHWPAPCSVATNYHKRLRRTGDIGLLPIDIIKTVVVSGKNCPSCKRFVTKHGGCPHMVCVCGNSFCWGCGKNFETGTSHIGCHKGGYHGDLHGTFEKALQTEDRYKLGSGQTQHKWYRKALRHRLEQHPLKVRKMKTSVKVVSKKLQNYIVRCEQHREPVSLDFHMPNRSFARESDKAAEFVKNTISLHTEMNHLAENMAVLLNADVLTRGSRSSFQHVLYRISTLASIIYELLVNGGEEKSSEELFNKFKEVRFHSRQCIQGLIKRVKAAGL